MKDLTRKGTLIIVSMSDPFSPSAGGITPDVIVYLGNLDVFSPALVGLRIGGEGQVGKWSEEELLGRSFQFLPVLNVESGCQATGRLPISPSFLLRLLRYRRAILHRCGSLHICRAELAVPFILGRRRPPVVVNIRGASKFLDMSLQHPFYKRRGVRWLYLQLEKYVLNRADAVVVVSEDAYRYYVERMPSLKGRLFLIPPSVDTDAFRPFEKAELRAKYGLPVKSRLLIYAGRFVPEKRVDALIESLCFVKKVIPDTLLLLVGEGPEMRRLERIAPNDGSVLFLGVLGRKQVAEVMSSCDVAVLFSEFEGMPLLVLESLACGIPVVSTDVGDVNKVVVDRSTGFVVSPPDVEAFADAICKAMEMPPSVSENCRRIAMNYSSRIITREVERLHTVLQERQRRA